MSNISDYVKWFKYATGQKPDRVTGRTLIHEEYMEWCDEIMQGNPEAELKELADLVYVIYAYADTMGWDLDEAVKRVHENNLSRVIQDDGSVIFREDGKVMKREDAPKVYLGDLV